MTHLCLQSDWDIDSIRSSTGCSEGRPALGQVAQGVVDCRSRQHHPAITQNTIRQHDTNECTPTAACRAGYELNKWSSAQQNSVVSCTEYVARVCADVCLLPVPRQLAKPGPGEGCSDAVPQLSKQLHHHWHQYSTRGQQPLWSARMCRCRASTVHAACLLHSCEADRETPAGGCPPAAACHPASSPQSAICR